MATTASSSTEYLIDNSSYTDFNNITNFLKNATVKNSKNLDAAETNESNFFGNLLKKYYDNELTNTDIYNLINFVSLYNDTVKKNIDASYIWKNIFGINTLSDINSESLYGKFVNIIKSYLKTNNDLRNNIVETFVALLFYQYLNDNRIYYTNNSSILTTNSKTKDSVFKNIDSAFSPADLKISFSLKNDINSDDSKYTKLAYLEIDINDFKTKLGLFYFTIDNDNKITIDHKHKFYTEYLSETTDLISYFGFKDDFVWDDSTKFTFDEHTILDYLNNELFKKIYGNISSDEQITSNFTNLLITDLDKTTNLIYQLDVASKILYEKEFIYMAILKQNSFRSTEKRSASTQEVQWALNYRPLTFFDIENISFVESKLADPTTIEYAIFDKIKNKLNIKNSDDFRTSGSGTSITDDDIYTFSLIVGYKELNINYRSVLDSTASEVGFYNLLEDYFNDVDTSLLVNKYPSSILSYQLLPKRLFNRSTTSYLMADDIQSLYQTSSDVTNDKLLFDATLSEADGTITSASSLFKYLYTNPYSARKAEESEIIAYYMGDGIISDGYGSTFEDKLNINNFLDIYKTTRDYYYRVLIDDAFINDEQYRLYEKFFISMWSIERFLSSKIINIHDIDYFDNTDVKNFLISYGLKVLNDSATFLNQTTYNKKILRHFNELVKLKGSKEVIDKLINVFDMADTELTINKFLLAEKNSLTETKFKTLTITKTTTSSSSTYTINGSDNFNNDDTILKSFKTIYSTDITKIHTNSFRFKDSLNKVLLDTTKLSDLSYDSNSSSTTITVYYSALTSTSNSDSSIIFLENKYSSDNNTRDLLNARTSVDYATFLTNGNDKYWTTDNVPIDDIKDLNINVANTKYLSLILKKNFYKEYLLARLSFGVINYMRDNITTNDSSIADKLTVNDSNFGSNAISLGTYYKGLEYLYQILLAVYGYNCKYTDANKLFSVTEKKYLGINNEYSYISTNVNGTSLKNDITSSTLLKSIIDDTKLTSSSLIINKLWSETNNIWSGFNIYQKQNNSKTLTDVGSIINNYLYSELKCSDNINSAHLNAGPNVVQYLEGINYILAGNDLSNYLDYYNLTKDISSYLDIYDQIMKLPTDYILGSEYIYDQAEYSPTNHISKAYRDVIDNAMNDFYLVDTDPLYNSNNIKLGYDTDSKLNKISFSNIKTIDNATTISEGYNSNFISYIFTNNGFSTTTTENQYDFDLSKLSTSSAYTKYVDAISTKIISMANIIQTTFATDDYLKLSSMISANQNNEINYLKAAVEIFISYTVMLRSATYSNEYNTVSESVPLAEDLQFTIENTKVDSFYYDDKLEIEQA